MRHSKNLFRKPAFSVFLFIICLVLFGWPLLSIVDSDPSRHVFLPVCRMGHCNLRAVFHEQKLLTVQPLKRSLPLTTGITMFDPFAVVIVVCLYIGLLFSIALWVERQASAGRSIGNNPYIYSLSLAVYCTTWTYYGSVGKAATSGMLFLCHLSRSNNRYYVVVDGLAENGADKKRIQNYKHR